MQAPQRRSSQQKMAVCHTTVAPLAGQCWQGKGASQMFPSGPWCVSEARACVSVQGWAVRPSVVLSRQDKLPWQFHVAKASAADVV